MDPTIYNFIIKDEMHNRRASAISKLSKIVHPKYQKEFFSILHYSWQEGLQEAQTIMDDIDFCKLDLYAMFGMDKEFSDLYQEEILEQWAEEYADYRSKIH